MSDNNADLAIAAGPFEATMDSLRTFSCPQWFRDAKLAFWSHWGPQSVPMYGDWYARHIYVEGHDQYRHHWRVYGHPSKHGYKDIVPHWKAEEFDPEGLMNLFVAAGAKYFLGQAMHHDNFDNFDSAHNRWNSVNIGPRKDIVKLWQQAAQNHGLKFGLTEHLAASFNWFGHNKMADKSGPYAGVPYDGNDPDFADLYYDNAGYTLGSGWYTDNAAFQLHWFQRIKDVIDKYQPDLLYSDGGLPFGEYGMKIVAHLYNTSAALNGGLNQAVYNQKDTNPEVFTIGVLDIERGQLDGISEHPWQTDTSVGDWFYNVRDKYKTAEQVLETLVDITSKNGCLALNIPQKPDGTLDDECTYLLRQMARWMPINGEGIFGSRPWRVAGEGAAAADAGAFKENAIQWSPQDFRFTYNNGTVYAYQMNPSDQASAVIHSLGSDGGKVKSVHVHGHTPLQFNQSAEGLEVHLPPATLPGPRAIAVVLE